MPRYMDGMVCHRFPRKKLYQSFQQAQAVKGHEERKRGAQVQVYPCQNHWHLGRRRTESYRFIKRGGEYRLDTYQPFRGVEVLIWQSRH